MELKIVTLLLIAAVCSSISAVNGQTTPKPTPSSSCYGNCNECISFSCCCDNACPYLGDCCPDFQEACPNACGEIVNIPNGGSVDITSPLYPNYYPDDLNCNWTIYTEHGSMIYFEHVDFNTEDGFDFYSAGNGDAPSQETSEVWRHSGSSRPEDFLTDSGTGWITFTSDVNTAARGFHTIVHDSGYGSCAGICGLYNNANGCSCTTTCIVSDDCCYDYFEYCAGDCNENIQIPVGGSVNVTSPNYPSNYPDNARCRWIVDTAQSTRIEVVFNDYLTELDGDYFFAGHGSLPSQDTSEIWGFSGSSLPPNYVTDGDTAWLQFVSNKEINMRGFHATLTDFGDCIYEITVPEGGSSIVTSTNYPEDYPNGESCQWVLTAVNGGLLNVTFDDFATELNHDFMFAGDGDTPSNASTVIEPHSGTTLPPDYMSTVGAVWYRFTSDESGTMRGFHSTAYWTYGSCEGKCDTMSNGCSCFSDCVQDGSCCPDYVIHCAECIDVYYLNRGESVNILSPNYPNDYHDNAQCQWIVNGDPGDFEGDYRIIVQFLDFRTQTGEDFLYAGHGNDPSQETAVIWEHSGNQIPDNFLSNNSSAWLRFTSNNFITFRGFYAVAHHVSGYCGGQCEFMSDGCSCFVDCIYAGNCCKDYFQSCGGNCTHTLVVPYEGSIDVYSPNYPSDYPNDARCQWIITTEGASQPMYVEYIDFETEQCCDFYFAGHGSSPSNETTEIYAHSGSSLPPNFTSLSASIWMRFISDSSVTNRGFHAKVYYIGN
ncbi:CUB and sushi domain-containing protein 1-like [Saccoglossus kowalevskii]